MAPKGHQEEKKKAKVVEGEQRVPSGNRIRYTSSLRIIIVCYSDLNDVA